MRGQAATTSRERKLQYSLSNSGHGKSYLTIFSAHSFSHLEDFFGIDCYSVFLNLFPPLFVFSVPSPTFRPQIRLQYLRWTWSQLSDRTISEMSNFHYSRLTTSSHLPSYGCGCFTDQENPLRETFGVSANVYALSSFLDHGPDVIRAELLRGIHKLLFCILNNYSGRN